MRPEQPVKLGQQVLLDRPALRVLLDRPALQASRDKPVLLARLVLLGRLVQPARLV